MHQFQRTADQANVTLADAVQRLQCSHCGLLFVAGVNCTVRTEKIGSRRRKSKQASKRCRNKIKTACHACKHATIVPGTTNSAVKKLGRPSPKPTSIVRSQPTPPVDSSKRRPKKKKLDLQAMIKQKNQPSTMQSSFVLDDFLSSL
jgi:hypothetical protein